jgi:hypothetical protein
VKRDPSVQCGVYSARLGMTGLFARPNLLIDQ